MIDRMGKISIMIQKELTVILQSYIDDPRVQHVTITKVEVSRDLRNARIMCSLNVHEDQKTSVLNGLKSAGSFIRNELAHRISLKFVPRLSFYEDGHVDGNDHIDELFKKIEREKMMSNRSKVKDYTPDVEAIRSILKVINENQRFVISAHVNPEGDSIGSQIAMYYFLKEMGKEVYIVNSDKVPENLKFLQGTTEVMSSIPVSDYVFIILDCPILDRIGKIQSELEENPFIINIDHHISNTKFADVNWVEENASSAGEMLFHLIKESGEPFINEMNEAIYTAIITDTGMFNYDNTTRTTHNVAGELVNNGVDTVYVHSNVYENKNFKEIRLFAKTLSTLRLEEDGKITSIFLTRQMLIEEDAEFVSTDEFINYPRSIKGVEVAVFLKQNIRDDDVVNISFRSTGTVDVNKIASRLGGGGHQKASGCRIECSVEEAYETVLEEITKELSVTDE